MYISKIFHPRQPRATSRKSNVWSGALMIFVLFFWCLGFNLTEAQTRAMTLTPEITISESAAVSKKELKKSIEGLVPYFSYTDQKPEEIIEKSKNPIPALLLEDKYVLEVPAVNSAKPKEEKEEAKEREQFTDYIVKKGDSLGKIANDFNINILAIKSANNLNSDIIQPGQKLIIPSASGIVYTIKRGDTLVGLVSRYGGDLKQTITKNNLQNTSLIYEGQKILIVGATKYPTVARERTWLPAAPGSASQYAPPVGTGSFGRPTGGLTISQYYRYGHRAIDIDWRSGLNIYASDGGRVAGIARGWNSGYGNTITINHGNGYVTRYTHLSRILVSPGQSVYRGQLIGIMGRTGRVYGRTGVHLHFEIIYNGVKLNPLSFIR